MRFVSPKNSLFRMAGGTRKFPTKPAYRPLFLHAENGARCCRRAGASCDATRQRASRCVCLRSAAPRLSRSDSPACHAPPPYDTGIRNFIRAATCDTIAIIRILSTVMAYVENNPVRARMVSEAEDYLWSSARAHLGDVDTSGCLDMSWWRGRRMGFWEGL